MNKKKSVTLMCVIAFYVVSINKLCKCIIKSEKKLELRKKESDKYNALSCIYNSWLRSEIKGNTVKLYLEKKSYKKLAIYGMGDIGNLLFDYFRSNNIEVGFIMDSYLEVSIEGVKIIRPEESFPEVDCIVITPIYDGELIKNKLRSKTMANLVTALELFRDLDYAYC